MMMRATKMRALKTCTCLTACFLLLRPELGHAQETKLTAAERSAAFEYARLIEEAYGRLSVHIRRTSTDKVEWGPSDIPPSSTGWESEWTKTGLRARYCDNSLLVYASKKRMKGIGSDQRQVQVALRSEVAGGVEGAPARLDWIEQNGDVTRGDGTKLNTPNCLDDNYSSPLPGQKVALYGPVIDPSEDLSKLIEWAARTEECPAGTHGSGVRERMSTTETKDGRGKVVSVEETDWQEIARFCRENYTYWTYFQDACTWYQGEPFNKNMSGITTYKILASVSAAGVQYGNPQVISSTCFNSTLSDPTDLGKPTANVTESSQSGSKTESCGSGYTGSKSLTRTRTVYTNTITYPAAWGVDDLSSVRYGAWSSWSVSSNSCTPVSSGDGGGAGNGGGYVDTDGDGFADSTPPAGYSGPTTDYGGAVSPGSGGSSGGGGSSSRILCTELYKQGLMSPRDWVMDCQHAKRFVAEHTVNGYHAWAKWVVTTQLRDSYGLPRTDRYGKIATKVWLFLAQRRANQIRHVMKTRMPERYGSIEGADNPDWVGVAIRWAFEPACYVIGVFAGKQDISKVHADPLRRVQDNQPTTLVEVSFGYGMPLAKV